MSLKEKFLNLIKNENKKDPYTDVKLAKLLATSRENITALRKELNIGNSRERRKPYLEDTIDEILKKDPKVNISKITRLLLQEGFDISRHVVEEILEESGKNIEVVSDVEENLDPFESLTGYNGSLKRAIAQAKSAILYPPFGLPTLITGESGVGKTQFAECMYNFAKVYRNETNDMPLVIFNCADYGDNPQLILSLLYGYKKGAFTGADSDSEGLVEQANNGILFLDEIHRLPPKGQEILFSILDRGTFRRLGETKNERKVNIMFIGATTENIESELLLTFRRRIPMVIAIPSLKDRFFVEKIDLIKQFFQQECDRINYKIYVEGRVIEILSLKRFGGNIGQLKSLVKVICARAFMKHINREEDIINIGYDEVLESNIVDNGLMLEDINIVEVRKYIKDIIFIPHSGSKLEVINKEVKHKDVELEDFYSQIEKKYNELLKLEMASNQCEEILWAFIMNKFKDLGFKNEKNHLVTLNELVNFVDAELIELIKELKLNIINANVDYSSNENVFIYLAIHLEEAIKRIRLKQQIININLTKIKKELKNEYEIALNFSEKLEEKKNIKVPEDEIGFIAMYINAVTEKKPNQSKVGVIVLSHGQIATEIIKVTKQLLNVDFPIAIDMPLSESPSIIYEKALVLSKIVDEGKGIIFLVDMGSLVKVGELVTEKLGIKTRTIDRVDLLSVIEAVRKASLKDCDLDEIYFSLVRSRTNYTNLIVEETSKPKAIVTLCLTGDGTALFIKESYEKKYPNLKIFQLGMMDEKLKDKIKEIQCNYKIIAIVGTINPEIEGINFIPYDPFYMNHGSRELEFVLNHSKSNIGSIFDDDLILFEPDIKNSKELIEIMCSLLINKGYVNKEFMKSVFKREEVVPTFFKGGVAMPHGDNSEVKKSSIVFVKLKRPINWGFGNVQIVCLPTLMINDKKIVKSMLKPFLNQGFIDELKATESLEKFKEKIYYTLN
ncbi:PTS sugar transporter [Clostridium zeae]|uniref:PTS sugar transporter n=1 Tax=Clostridium zeae TaxID=2759022 RepID=A0ABQ1E9Z4_9CLOT|nr:sigma 54-interacting transcriptional regulator [Clostridium zeae]GFZ31600.1 PTS sugar transporter [Clostridium zeae]